MKNILYKIEDKIFGIYSKIGNKIAKITHIPIDKQLHFITGFIIAAISKLIAGLWVSDYHSYIISFVVTVIFGLGKEIVDKIYNNNFSIVDFTYTFFGYIACGTLFSLF